jgi:hypothetical protein
MTLNLTPLADHDEAYDFLTPEEVIQEAETYAREKGNPALAPLIGVYYRKEGAMMPAVMRSLRLEAVTLTVYRRRP